MSKRLPKNVKISLNKALESALLAIEVYNKPAVKFKSGGFIVLMSIAWTSLFHAIFFKKNKKPYYKQKNSRYYKKIDGQYQFWELKSCVKNYFGGTVSPIKSNLLFFIPLRNQIEHKFMPEIDANIFAECQSLLINFDSIVEKEFGQSYCLRESLSFSLQLFPSSETLCSSIKSTKDSEKIVDFIRNYRSQLSPDIRKSMDYSFKAILIQVQNSSSNSALPIQFYKYNELTEEEKKYVDSIASITKEKYVSVANKGTLKPQKVVDEVNLRLVEKGFSPINMSSHTQYWHRFKVRPKKGECNPESTEDKFCIYDEPNKSYLYTTKWVDFIVDKELNK